MRTYVGFVAVVVRVAATDEDRPLDEQQLYAQGAAEERIADAMRGLEEQDVICDWKWMETVNNRIPSPTPLENYEYEDWEAGRRMTSLPSDEPPGLPHVPTLTLNEHLGHAVINRQALERLVIVDEFAEHSPDLDNLINRAVDGFDSPVPPNMENT